MRKRDQRRSSVQRSVRHEVPEAGRLAQARMDGRPARGSVATGRTGARSRWLRTVAAVLVAALLGAGWWLATPEPAYAGEITVYKSPTCQCCELWLRHMRRAGFEVIERNVPDMGSVKKEHGVPSSLTSCHTSVVGGYVVEGHVPAEVVTRLLDERPIVAGLAVPGMPAGSPGMESGGKEPYDVLTFTRDDETAVYARR